MTPSDLLSRFKGVRRSGDGWIALCPGHEDRNPSLSIHERTGKILLLCHAGCTTEAVCAAAGIVMRDLFLYTDNVPRIVAEYNYTDETGKLLYQVVRFEPKDFRQRRPDGNGGWTWNLNGVRRVLYRLPEALAAKSVLVVEGEKDVETASKLGLVATCNAGGAGKWREESSESLRGKRIAIIADADEPGRKHAQQVAASLCGKTESLKVLELPGAKDLSEWVGKGGTRLGLLELIRSTPEWKPAGNVTQQTGFQLMALAELFNKPQVKTEWLWHGRLAAGTISGTVSKPKVGKSTLARNLTLATSRGESFLGFSTRPGTCIYLALEERAEDIAADFRAMGANGDEPILIHADSAPAEGILALVDLVRERKPVLAVIDPLFRLARIKDEKAYGETYAALGPLIDVARASGTHLLLTHHSGKSAKADPIDSPLGSTALGGAVSTLIVLRRTENYRLIQTVQRLGQDLPETVLSFDPETRQLSLGGSKLDSDREECERAIAEFLRDAGELQTQAQVRDGVEGQTRIIRAALTALAVTGRITKTGEGTKGNPFLYGFENTGSLYIPGTRKPESQNVAEPRINTSDMLVPDSLQNPILVPDDSQKGNPPEEGEL
jgi:hypothetical protein